jgi:hypothetical protein
METISGFDFFRLHFDADGKLEQNQELGALKQGAAQATDAIFIAHGFRNDENDATGLYTRFLQNLRAQINGPFQATLGPRRFVVGGVYWPSKRFSEDVNFEGSAAGIEDEITGKEQVRAKLIDLRDTVACAEQKPRIDKAIALLDQVKGNTAAQDRFADDVLSLLDGSELDANEGIDDIRAKSGSELLASLSTPIRNPVAPVNDGEGGVAGLGGVFVPGGDGGTEGLGAVAGSIFGRIGQFLNMTTWYTMKNRSGVVGENGVARAVRDLKAAVPAIRIHLVGHSLGGRLMAGCAKSLAENPMLRPDSLMLLEAAFSHFGFSPNNGQGLRGYFRSVVESGVVKGPLIATFSAQDSVVGTVYAVASRLAGQTTEAVGDANDPFGGIGRNGAQKTAEAVVENLHPVGTPYHFVGGKILNLDGSGLIKDHGDVTNPNIAYAFASVVAATSAVAAT